MPLPTTPTSWPEPWRSLYEELSAERVAIMSVDGAGDEAIQREVLRIEDELRRAHEAEREA